MAKKILLGDLLVKNNLITQEQLNTAINHNEKTGKKLGQILIDLKYINEEQLARFLALQLAIPYIDLNNYQLNREYVNLLSENDALQYGCIILNKDAQGLLVGMVDPLNLMTCDEIAKLLKQPVHFAVVKQSDLFNIITAVYRQTTKIKGFAAELSESIKKVDLDLNLLEKGYNDQDTPVNKLLDSIFSDAVQVNASDIHIEPDDNLLRIRLRIDGVLQEQIIQEQYIAKALTLKLKLLSGLNIAETRLPQDGRFSIKIKNMNYDVRLSTLPIQHGESVVMRLLKQSENIISLTGMGISHDILDRIRTICSAPNGIILSTGPTGSGKSTTLYGLLSEMNDAGSKIITVEDPVEYHFHRINQVQVQNKINLTFANILRSVLRQDPDIIMIGELRDKETVDIALRAAMTGHFVYSTLHTNDSASAIIRLLDLGAESFILASVLRGVIAQRLVRRICPNCKSDYELSDQEMTWLLVIQGNGDQPIKKKFKKGMGCNYCHNTGYQGQIGIYELLEVTFPIATAIRENRSSDILELATRNHYYIPLLKSCINLINNDITTIQEVMRVMGELASDVDYSWETKPSELTEKS